ncbi:MAG TPA: glycosyltransferase family 2 protein [Chloroflexota bacterium]|nr:glycosyltransferase family 2 protein [Chloroflexota bacterium]
MEKAEVASPQAQRALELLTGALTWGLITAPVWGAVLAPAKWAWLATAFSLYWLYKSLSVAVSATLAYRRLELARSHDWLSAVQRRPGWRNVHHLIVFPCYTEPLSVLADSLQHLVEQDYPRDRISVLLAFEERETGAPAKARQLQEMFAGQFANLWTTFHPDRPGEVWGKSSNLAYAVPWARRALAADAAIHLGRVLVTICDADARLDARYLSALTWRYLEEPDAEYVLYQPVVFFHANIRRLPLPLRILNSMYSVMQLSRMLVGFRLITQSNYSLPLELCHRAGYWDVDVIPEDSHMFFKALFRCGERVRVVPLFVPVWSDAAEGACWWRTVLSHYRQARRWAWGISDVPYLLWQAARERRGRMAPRYIHAAHYAHEHFLWPSHWFWLVGSFNLLPFLAPSFAASHIGRDLAELSSAAYTACLPSLLVLVWLNWKLRPPGGSRSLREVVDFVAAWVCLPVVGFALVALPAVDAHSRLLLGRYLRYQVTEKQGRPLRERGGAPAGATPLARPGEAA